MDHRTVVATGIDIREKVGCGERSGPRSLGAGFVKEFDVERVVADNAVVGELHDRSGDRGLVKMVSEVDLGRRVTAVERLGTNRGEHIDRQESP